MKPIFAVYIVAAILACLGWNTRGHASEADQTVQDPTITRPKPPTGQTPGEHQPGALFCAFGDNQDEFVHVLLCRFEDSEDCVLTAPKPLKAMLQRFDAMKILKIGSTDDGCSELIFSGYLKSRE